MPGQRRIHCDGLEEAADEAPISRCDVGHCRASDSEEPQPREFSPASATLAVTGRC